jgi:hypothetical protein
MGGTRLGFVVLFLCLLGVGLSPNVNADTECDDPGIYGEYLATIHQSYEEMINSLLNYIGDIALNNMTITETLFITCEHTINITMLEGTVVSVDDLDFQVVNEVGKFAVHMFMNGSQQNPVLEGSTHITVDHWGHPILCAIENGILDAMLDDQTFGIRMAGGELIQEVDVCITGAPECMAIHPMEEHSITVQGLELDILGDGWGDLIDNIVSWLANIFMPAFSGLILDDLEDKNGMGLLIKVFHFDIVRDGGGCTPIPEVTACKGGVGCATIAQPGRTVSRRANFLWYGLPIALMVGLIVWRRKK